jgi:UDP-4-amino-4,6-dideoxy-N-acetyl-beta-L-altrosamine N-acetyltransferase
MSRCLTLARELKRQGAFILFLCRSLDLNWMNQAREIVDDCVAMDWQTPPDEDVREVVRLYHQCNIDQAIIDHYRVDQRYQKQLYESGVRWLQFDGSASEPFLGEWVFNASPSAREDLYGSLKRRQETNFLLGSAFALIRREFIEKKHQIQFREKVRKILMTFGGGDDRGCTVFCLDSLKSLDPAIERLVLVSSANPRKGEISEWVNKHPGTNVTLLLDVPDVAACMLQADLAIIAGGTTTFETAAMGLPSLIIEIADNQAPNARAWQEQGAAVNLGLLEKLTPQALFQQMISLIQDPARRKAMSEAGQRSVDGQGVQRVAKILEGITRERTVNINLRQDFDLTSVRLKNFVHLTEKEMIRNWRNDPEIRKWMFTDHLITPDEHDHFIDKLMVDDQNFYWLVQNKEGQYLGVISINKLDQLSKTAYFGLYVRPDCKGQGYGHRLMTSLKELVFDVAKLETLKLEVLSTNERALEFYRKSGFDQEQQLPGFVFKEQKWQDVTVMGMSKDRKSQIV